MEHHVNRKEILCLVIIIVVGTLDIFYGQYFNNKNNINDYIKVKSNIHQLTKSEKVSTLYVDYYINGKKYNSVIISNNEDISMGKSIDIYCSKKELTKCIEKLNNKSGNYISLIGIIVILISIVGWLNIIKRKCNTNDKN